jgi:2-hydroxycyclohexanecarboxyl-CoA dehydrogenase
MDLDLKGKSVIVTGGGSNIGRGIVLGFAAEGANITIGDIDDRAGQKTAELALAAARRRRRSSRPMSPSSTRCRPCSRWPPTGSAASMCWSTTSAGTKLMFFTQTTPDLWQKIININYVGVLNCTKTALEVMVPRNAGSIVSISSDASRQGEPREAVYGGVKAAINSFMKTIAKENGRYGIRCNVVCPGVTIPSTADEVGGSSMWIDAGSMFTPEQLEKVAKALPLRKVGRPQDIANAVVFLSSAKAAGHVTGQVLSCLVATA